MRTTLSDVDLLPEPPDGTVLVVYSHPGEYRTVVRDDKIADEYGPDRDPLDRWYDCHPDAEDYGVPMALTSLLEDATTVYKLGEKIA